MLSRPPLDKEALALGPYERISNGLPVRFTSALGGRRDEAALSSGCKPHPAIDPAGSSRKQPEQPRR
jgi:hypothetical protein